MTAGTHIESEDHPWSREIPDHAQRTESRAFVAARALMHKIAGGSFAEALYGPAKQAQAHHGGSLWFYPNDDPSGQAQCVRNLAGIEWSAQFGADPARVDIIRQSAQAFYTGFPKSAEALGLRALLDTPITTADQVAAFTDSPLNACVPLPANIHTGTKPEAGQAGIHHFPDPVMVIPLFAQPGLRVFVPAGRGQVAAVAPVAPRGSGDGRVRVLYAPPTSTLGKAHAQAHAAGNALVLPAASTQAKAAFAGQQTSG